MYKYPVLDSSIYHEIQHGTSFFLEKYKTLVQRTLTKKEGIVPESLLKSTGIIFG
jgi:hypothetical protein